MRTYVLIAALLLSAFRLSAQTDTARANYNAACSRALSGDKDKAFFYLYLSMSEGWDAFTYTASDPDLSGLHNDDRWQPFLNRLRANSAARGAKMDTALVAELDTVFKVDQASREKMMAIVKRSGWKAPELKDVWPAMKHGDSLNLIKVKRILDTRGWLGPGVVGDYGNNTLFLVIQHADSLTQVTYLPMMREAVKNGRARPSDLALLEDRVLVRQGKPQIYGSQVRANADGKPEFFPIEDEAHVDQRRASMGLPTLAEYAKNFGIELK